MKTSQDLLFLTYADINSYFAKHVDIALDTVKNAYLAFANSEAINPPSSFLWYNKDSNSRIISLPAFINNEHKSLGIKWISSNPENIQNGLPRASALIIMNDYKTGYPIAVLEGAQISALRTALSALLATDFLHQSKNIQQLAIIGCGNIAKTYLNCMRALNWQVAKIKLYDVDTSRAKNFAKENCDDAEVCTTIAEVTSDSDVVLLTTTELSPYINEHDYFAKGATVLNISLRDLAADIILKAFNIVDDIENVLHANTSPHLAYLDQGNKDFIQGTISGLIENQIPIPNDKLKVFSPMGLGILDIALADLALRDFMNNENKYIKNYFKSSEQ